MSTIDFHRIVEEELQALAITGEKRTALEQKGEIFRVEFDAEQEAESQLLGEQGVRTFVRERLEGLVGKPVVGLVHPRVEYPCTNALPHPYRALLWPRPGGPVYPAEDKITPELCGILRAIEKEQDLDPHKLKDAHVWEAKARYARQQAEKRKEGHAEGGAQPS